MKPPGPLRLFSILILSAQISLADSAQWKLNPGSGDWSTASNWTPATVPNGPLETAVFATSNQTAISLSDAIEVNGITFNRAASAFTIAVPGDFLPLTISGVGIINNSGRTQNFLLQVNGSEIDFTNNATVGSSTDFVFEGFSGAIKIVVFFNSSTAGNASFTMDEGGVNFLNSSSADASSFKLNGGNGFVFFNNTATAANAVFTLNGPENSPSYIFFDGSSTAANGSFTLNGYSEIHFEAYLGDDSATAGNGIFTINGRTISGAPGAYVGFQDHASADNATLIANGGLNGGVGGAIYFFLEATGGTARAKVFGTAAGDFIDGNLDISCHSFPGVMIGSVEGNGTVFLGANELAVGSNNLSTTFSGVIADGGYCDGVGGSIVKSGIGTFSLTNGNSYSGGTHVSNGTLQALHDGALGGGDVTALTSGTTLTLQGGATNNYIADAATLDVVSSAIINLNFDGTDTIGVLIVDGVPQPPGLHGAGFASAASRSPLKKQMSGLIGTGQILAKLPVAVSRKLHNGNPFDIYLPLIGTPGIECRSGGGSNVYQIVVSFLNNATFSSASVTSGQGAVTGTSGGGTKNVTIDLFGVTNAQTINVTLFNLNDGLGTRDLVIPMSVLVGDTNGNRAVNSSDISQIKAQSGHAITNSNFREDVNGNGAINSSDIVATKAKSGTALP